MSLPELSEIDSAWKSRFRGRLNKWFAVNARDLPWRRSRDPYRVWVSEIMLQQTQVATVEGYFNRFVERFPHVHSLAAAEEEDVLRLWEGLGYYSRARQLHKAARVIVARHEGRFPSDLQAVRDLPGIGRYTAGAILSIAFDQRQPILEANTIRIFARLLAFEGDTTSKHGQEVLWGMAETVLPRKNVGLFNQALMELGSEVCRGKMPLCRNCPVEPLCATRQQGKQDSIPRPKARRRIEAKHHAVVLLRHRQTLLMLKNTEPGRWSGLWDFPRVEIDADHPDNVRRQIIEKVTAKTGLNVELGKKLTTLTHGVTRFRITLDCYEGVPTSDPDDSPKSANAQWVAPEDLGEYPLNVTARKVSRFA